MLGVHLIQCTHPLIGRRTLNCSAMIPVAEQEEVINSVGSPIQLFSTRVSHTDLGPWRTQKPEAIVLYFPL